MKKEEILNYLKINNGSGHKTKEKHFIKNFPEIYNEIFNYETGNDWYEKLFLYLNNITKIPTCKTCDKELKFNGYNIGYYNYCSVSCKNKSEENKNKIKITNLEKFGVENPQQNTEIRRKTIVTNLNKYGVKIPSQSTIIKEKTKETNLNKYGTICTLQNEEIKLKKEQNNLKKHNVKQYTNRKKALDTNEKKYGNKNYNNAKKIKFSLKKTYGNQSLKNNIIEKRKKTNLIKYGVEFFSQTEKYKNNINAKIKTDWAKKLNINVNNIEYYKGKFIIKNQCIHHNEFEIDKNVLRNRLNYGVNVFCTKCNPVSEQTSIKEKEVVDFIKSLNILNTIYNSREIINKQELDIYLPDHKLAIEFNGLYYHSNIFIDKNYHLNKTTKCEENKIQLLHIFEDEWIYKKEIVKSIIKSKLGIIENKIYGRKCEIREISDNSLVKDFLNKNHIQGFVGSQIKIGLFYKDELVSLMTFGKKRKIMNTNVNENEYEMLRFCNKIDTTVIGGASKLFNYFIAHYHPQNIITYADRRYSNGSLYYKLGMKFIKNTEPNYWYFKQNTYDKYHRFVFRKDVLVKQGFDPHKTEKQIMTERDYLRIYDCGNMKFEFNRSL